MRIVLGIGALAVVTAGAVGVLLPPAPGPQAPVQSIDLGVQGRATPDVGPTAAVPAPDGGPASVPQAPVPAPEPAPMPTDADRDGDDLDGPDGPDGPDAPDAPDAPDEPDDD